MLNKYYDKRKIRSWNLFFSVCDTPFVIIIGKRCSISIYFDRYDFLHIYKQYLWANLDHVSDLNQ